MTTAQAPTIPPEAPPDAAGDPLVDPFADLTVGAVVTDLYGWADPVTGIRIGIDSGAWCALVNPDGSPGMCSRRHDHPAELRHVAAGGESVTSAWTTAAQGPDPMADVAIGTSYRDVVGGNDPETGMRVPDESTWCRQTKEGQPPGLYCTRKLHHVGRHMSTRSGGTLAWVEDRPIVPTQLADRGVLPTDPEHLVRDEVWCIEAPAADTVVRLRDRTTRLYVLGARRATAEVDTIDLATGEGRTVPIDRCVPLPVNEAAVALDELPVLTRWFAGHRTAVRNVAVREHRSGRWCSDGLDRNLRDLGMAPHVPQLTGEVRVTVPFICPDVHAVQSRIERAVREALADPSVSAAMRVALPPIEGIELEPERLTVSANNFHRR